MSIEQQRNEPNRWSFLIGSIVALLGVGAVAGGTYALRFVFPGLDLRAPYILVIGLVAYFFGAGPGSIALILSCLGYVLFLGPPSPIVVTARLEYVTFFIVSAASLIAMNSLRNTKLRIAERNIQLEAEVRERRRVEGELHALAQFPDESPNPVMRIAADGRLLYSNYSSEYLLVGCRGESGSGLPDGVLAAAMEALSIGTIRELAFGCGDKVFSMMLVPVIDRGYVNVYGRDITESKRNEEALRDSEQRFRTLADNISQLAWMTDETGSIFWYNKRWYDYTGTTLEQTQGWGWQQVHHPDHLERVTEKFRRSLESREAWEDTFPLRGRDGNYRWFLSRAVPVTDEHGRVVRWFGTNTDVTELRDSQEALKLAVMASERDRAQLEAVFQSVADGIVVSDMTGKFVLVNEAEARINGYGSPAEMERDLEFFAEVYELSYPDGTTLKVQDWPMSKVLRGESFVKWELRGRRRDTGAEWFFSFSGEPVHDDHGNQILGVVITRDITASKQAEEQVRTLNAELEQRVAERTEELQMANRELEAFSYSVSHDLRAPLRAIDGFSNTLLKMYHDQLDERGQDYLQRVRNAAQRMGRLIDDILGLSRAGRAEMHLQRVDLSAMASEIISELRTAQPERRAQVHIEPGLVVSADSHLLRIALTNLLENAWKFTGNRDVACIELGATEANGEQMYFVRDNGAGFNPEYATKLFSPFQRLHSDAEFPGTGIGLALVQRILRRHGGRIWAESAADQGATFYFTIGEGI